MTFLFGGTEIGQKNERIAQIKEAAQKRCGSLNSFKFYAFETDIQAVFAVLATEPLFGGANFVVVQNAECWKCVTKGEKAGFADLEKWGKSKSDNTLILCTDETKFSKPLESLADKPNQKIFWELGEAQKKQWIKDFFAKNGMEIEAEAIDEILELVENDTASMKSACLRFCGHFEKGRAVSLQDVGQILSHDREESAFSLFDAMCAADRNATERFSCALEILQKLQLSKDNPPIKIIAGLLYCFRRLKVWHSLCAHGRPDDFSLRKNGFSNWKAQTQFASAAKTWNAAETQSAVAILCEFDSKIRTSFSNAAATMQLCVYALVFKRKSGFLDGAN